MGKEIIISAAVCGSQPTKEQNLAVPYTPEEIIEQAVNSHKAGAAIAHIHVRNPQTGEPVYNRKLFAQVLDGIKDKTAGEMLVNLTTSNYQLPVFGRDRLQTAYLRPDLCSLDVGSVNFKNGTFINPPDWGVLAAKTMKEQRVKPEIEVFEIGHIGQAKKLIADGLIDAPYWFQLCMGAGYGIPASKENLEFMQKNLPKDTLWSVLGVGRHQTPMITLAAEMGGHIRVGFEDNIMFEKNVPAKSNAQFVEQAVAIAENHGRTVVTSSRTREILGILKA